MNTDLRKVMVVGAGSGIGAATAAHFHGCGDYVAAVDYRSHQTPASEHLECDLRDADAIDRLLQRAGPNWDVLAYVAGVPGTAPALDVLAVNYLGLRRLAEGMLPQMRAGGAVVAVASTAASAWPHRIDALAGLLSASDPDGASDWLRGQDPSYPVYNASKEAVVIYTKRLAATAWNTYGIRVNTVSPGPVRTPILPDFEQTMGADILELARNTVGRHADVGDIVPVIAFLSSAEAGWINGQDIQVDGGFVTSLTVVPPITPASLANGSRIGAATDLPI